MSLIVVCAWFSLSDGSVTPAARARSEISLSLSCVIERLFTAAVISLVKACCCLSRACLSASAAAASAAAFCCAAARSNTVCFS